jgi:SsrA-binding protein
MSTKLTFERNISIKNKRASFEYALLDHWTAGMVLTGTEIKSIRMGKVDLSDAFCFYDGTELFVKDLFISPYEKGGNWLNHEGKRTRKLLLNRQELKKLSLKLKDVGLTIIPTRLFINDRGVAKLDIALAKGKKLHDKRESLKEKDQLREVSRNFR